MSVEPDDIEREEGLSALYEQFKEQYSLDMNQEVDLALLIRKGETSNVDFKEKLELDTKNKKSNFLKDVCSIANSTKDMGFLIIGVTDDKKIVGSEEISEEQIQSICYRYISPRINIECIKIIHKDKSVDVIQVGPTGKPFEISKDIDNLKQHDVFIRCGTINQKASPREIIEMGKWSELNNEDSSNFLNKNHEKVVPTSLTKPSLRAKQTGLSGGGYERKSEITFTLYNRGGHLYNTNILVNDVDQLQVKDITRGGSQAFTLAFTPPSPELLRLVISGLDANGAEFKVFLCGSKRKEGYVFDG